MSAADLFGSAVGEWVGTNRLVLPDADRTVPSTATVALVAQGKFCTIGYTWSFDGTPQDGLLVIGHSEDVATVLFLDSFHMGDGVLSLRGTADAAGVVEVLGSYSVGDGPDWGWRIVFAPSAETLAITMYNIEPESEPTLAVEAKYTRSA